MDQDSTKQKSSLPIFKILGGICFIAIIAVAFASFPVGQWLEHFNEWVANLGAIGILLFILVYIVAAVTLLPASALTIGAGFAFGLGWGMLAVSIGSTLGAGAAFLASRTFAGDWVRNKMGTGKRFKAIDHAVSAEGWKIVGLLRLSPLFPYSILNYLLGLTSIRFWHYLGASWIGMLPGTLLYVYLGYAGKAGLQAASTGGQDIMRTVYLGLGLLATLAVTVYVTRLARRAVQQATEIESEKND